MTQDTAGTTFAVEWEVFRWEPCFVSACHAKGTTHTHVYVAVRVFDRQEARNEFRMTHPDARITRIYALDDE